MKAWTLFILVALLSGCAGGGGSAPSDRKDSSTKPAPAPSGGGGRYAMSGDAYPEQPPDVSQLPDAVPRVEPPSRGGNRPTYEVWGKTYQVLPDSRGYAKAGTASWYGEKFHGYATSNGEIYDMYKMSAAHRSLPLPTYARVTSLENGRSVIVRVNDRGPFHSDREIDLSYAAAARLDILDRGTGGVKVEAIDPERWLAENGSGYRNAAASTPLSTPVRQTKTTPAPQAGSAVNGSSADVTAAIAAGSADGSPAKRRPTEGSPAERRPADGSPIYLQIAALGSAENAQALRVRLQTELTHPVRVTVATGIHRVQVGPLAHAGEVDPVRDELRRAGFDQAFVVNGAD